MKFLNSDMLKSTKFVQWLIANLVFAVVFLFVCVPIYIVYREAIFAEPMDPNLVQYLLGELQSWSLLLLGALGVGNVSYGVFNQIQKYSPTEKIKTQARVMDSSKQSGFTGIEIKREYHIDRTLGKAKVIVNGEDKFDFVTIELPDKGNQRSVSCILEGEYDVVWEYSAKFREMLPELKNVPNRSEIKFHQANLVYELEGCIAPGIRFADVDGDGKIDVASSQAAMDKIKALLPGNFKVKIYA